MKINILTIFPDMFESMFNTSILGRAQQNGLIEITTTDIRAYSLSKHKNTDDYPYGGGAGMLMMAQPIADAIKDVKSKIGEDAKVIYMSPRGKTLSQSIAEQLSKEQSLIILCGHYEGVDQRVLDKYVDMELSIGDYVLTGGEVAAAVVVDCISRLVPGVLGSEASPEDESFSSAGLLEYPQYTRPRVFEDMEVPEVLLNGDHAKINEWRRQQSILITAQRRPDMLEKAPLTDKERKWLKNHLPDC